MKGGIMKKTNKIGNDVKGGIVGLLLIPLLALGIWAGWSYSGTKSTQPNGLQYGVGGGPDVSVTTSPTPYPTLMDR
jgi:hypothetical protein